MSARPSCRCAENVHHSTEISFPKKLDHLGFVINNAAISWFTVEPLHPLEVGCDFRRQMLRVCAGEGTRF